jgi:RNA polymerase sigma-70 factor (ECF subfamily)
MDDAATIARSHDQPVAFEAIFERHFAVVHRYLRRRVGDALAEELAAETFTRAFASRRRFASGPGGSARPWLFGIAENLVRGHRRSEERRWRAYARAHVTDAPAPPDVDGRLDARAAAAEALAALSADQRAVLLLTAWAELSGDEIALALGVAPATVRSRLGRARARLQSLPALQAVAPTTTQSQGVLRP